MKQTGAGNAGAGNVLDHDGKVTVAAKMIDPSLLFGQTVSKKLYRCSERVIETEFLTSFNFYFNCDT